jgi:rubrerythrin
VTDAVPIVIENPWLHPVAAGQPPPTSDRLIRALEAHAAAESADVANYRRLAQDSSDSVVSLLVGLITDDEQRHDTLLRSMIHRLQEEL